MMEIEVRSQKSEVRIGRLGKESRFRSSPACPQAVPSEVPASLSKKSHHQSPQAVLPFRLLLALFVLMLMPACARHHSAAQGNVCMKPCRAVPAPMAVSHPTPTPPQPHSTKPLIMIDPGHGGKDLGAVSPSKPVYQEKNLNLASARFLEQFLKQKGYRTLMTRSDDTFLTLEERAELAKKKQADLFVSVHYNSAPNHTADGIEVFYYQPDKDKDKNKERTKKSEALAKSVLDKVIENTQAKSRGVKHGNYSVIRNSSMPAILIEGGFLTNEKELERLKDPAYLKKLAWGIAQGIDNYVQKQAK